MKKLLSILCIAILTCSLAACGGSGESDGTTAAAATVEDLVSPLDISFTAEELDGAYDESSAIRIALDGSGASCDSAAVTCADGGVTITAGGVYLLQGSLDDGSVIVDSGDEQTVQLVLDGADIHCADSAAIFVRNAAKTILTLAADSENSLADGESYTLDAEGEPTACLFSKDDLVINGAGRLTVRAAYNDGITGKDDLKLTGGVITVTAADDGVVGKDLLAATTVDLTVEAGGDGLKASNDSDAAKGVVYLLDGSYTIRTGADGVQAVSGLQIEGGSFTIASGGGSANSSTKAGQSGNSWGQWGPQAPAATDSATTDAATASAKGLKSTAALLIRGGDFALDTSDDSIHCNGSLQINGGSFAISSGDDGVHADTAILIRDAALTVDQCYEGVESANITITGGNFAITAGDDAINIAGGNDSSAQGGRIGENTYTEGSDQLLTIHGGEFMLDAQGDGIDVNGAAQMTGGTVIVNGPTNSGNGALDYSQGFTVSGGTLVAAGASGMALDIGSDSTLARLALGGVTLPAGTALTVEGSSGKVILTFTLTKAQDSAIIAAAGLCAGETYTVKAGTTTVTTATAAISEGSNTMMPPDGGGMGGGVQPPDGGTPPEGKDAPPSQPNAANGVI